MNTHDEHTGAAKNPPPGFIAKSWAKVLQNPIGVSISWWAPSRMSIGIALRASSRGLQVSIYLNSYLDRGLRLKDKNPVTCQHENTLSTPILPFPNCHRHLPSEGLHMIQRCKGHVGAEHHSNQRQQSLRCEVTVCLAFFY